MKPKMEIRIWGGSPLIGKTVEQIDQKFNVKITKVARGIEATNPDENLKIEASDYISYRGEPKACLNLLKSSAK